MDSYALYIHLAGLAVIVVGCLGLLIRAFPALAQGPASPGIDRSRLVITGFPPAYQLLAPIDLGPREKMVDGERHITLTGWDRKDYWVPGVEAPTSSYSRWQTPT